MRGRYNPLLKPPNMWRRVSLIAIVNLLDDAGYDCYYDSDPRADNNGRIPRGPSLYLITGGCLAPIHGGHSASEQEVNNGPHGVRGWANVACVPRAFAPAAAALRKMATALPAA
jgi:hypothetical protein